MSLKKIGSCPRAKDLTKLTNQTPHFPLIPLKTPACKQTLVFSPEKTAVGF
jgi:hypothetical protein